MLITLLTMLSHCAAPTPSRAELLQAVAKRDSEQAAAVAASLSNDDGGVISVYPERVRRISEVRYDARPTARAETVNCGYIATYRSSRMLEVAALACTEQGWVIRDAMAVTLERSGPT
jgi:hypothetical protein